MFAAALSIAKKGKPTRNKGITGDQYRQHYTTGLTPPSMAGRIWINNGVEQRKILHSDEMPDRWIRGRCDIRGDNNSTRKKRSENKIN